MADNANAKAKYHILVVDDESTVCKAIEMILKHHGHQVHITHDGNAALLEFEKRHFDLVITDYLMPGMKGDEFVNRIKKFRPNQKIILVTAFAEDFLSGGRPLGGVDCVLNKPFSLEELRLAILKVLEPA